MKKERVRALMQYWKMGVHLIFRTKQFGVNNKWWGEGHSIFGKSWMWRIYAILTIRPLILEYRRMKQRAGGQVNMMTDEQYELIFGHSKEAKR